MKKTFFLLFTLIAIGCAKNYQTTTIQQFETALKEKNIDRIIYDAKNKMVVVEYKDSGEMFEIENKDENILSKQWIPHIRSIVDKYENTGIIFENKSSLF